MKPNSVSYYSTGNPTKNQPSLVVGQRLESKGTDAKIQKLSFQISELRENLSLEDQALDNMDKLQQRSNSVVTSQINALRKAFNMLADVVMEEIETIKVDMFNDLTQSNIKLSERVINLEQQIQTRIPIDQLEEIVERKLSEQIQLIGFEQNHFQILAQSIREENSLFLEKMKVIASNNSNRIDILSKERQITQQSINEAKQITQQCLGKFVLSTELEKQIQEQNGKQAAIALELKNFQTQTQERLSRLQKELIQKQDQEYELSSNRDEGKMKQQMRLEDKVNELETSLESVSNIMENNLKDVILSQKDIAKTIIMNFERSLNETQGEYQLVFKKQNLQEHYLNTTRDQIFQVINEQEQAISKRIDEVIKQFTRFQA